MVITRQLTDSASASTASDIQLGSCVTEIGQGAFSGYTNITDVEFPDSLTTIGVGAFSGSSITSVEFPDSLETIGDSAFGGCYGLETVDIPDSVSTIGNYAFNFPMQGESLTECTIGSGVTSIGNMAFNGNTDMRKLTIKATTPPTLGNNALDGNYLIYVPYSSYNDYISESGWVNYKNRIVYNDFPYKAMFITATGGLENFVPCNSSSALTKTEVDNTITTATTKVRFGNCVTTIGDGYHSVFSGTSLTDVEFSESITTISGSAFYKCTSGIHISSFPSSVTYIGQYAFDDGNTTIDNLTIGNNVTTIGYGAFRDTTIGTLNLTGNSTTNYGNNIFETSKISNLNFGDSFTSITEDMFSRTSGLTSVTIPSSVISVGNSAFYRSNDLKTLSILGNASIGNSAFNSCASLSSVTIPNVTTVGTNAFYGCSGLTKINASSTYDAVINLTTIETGAFRNNGFETLELGANATSVSGDSFSDNRNLRKLHIIGNSSTKFSGSTSYGAFRNCTALTEVIIDNANSFYSGTFSGSNAIQKVTIGDGYSSIDNGLFQVKTSLTSLTLSNGVTSIGERTFSGCTSLPSLDLPSNLQSIGASAFTNCSSISTLIIPDSVISIGNNAFSGCSGLNSILIGRSTPPTIGTNVFAGSNCLIYVPQASYDLYVNAENWSTYRDRIFATGVDYKAMLIGGTSSVINCNDNTTLALSEIGSNNAETINIGNCVTAIGDSAFTSSNSIQTVSIPSGVTSIGNSVFYNRRTLTTVSGMQGVETIGNDCFNRCSGLTSFTFPSGLTSVGFRAFRDCNGLGGVTLPSTVTSISNNAFYANLDYVKLTSTTPPELVLEGQYYENYCFGQSGSTAYPIYVPCSSYETYKTAWNSYNQIKNRITPWGDYTKTEEVVGEYLCENGGKYKKMEIFVSSDNVTWCSVGYQIGDLIESGAIDCATRLHLEYNSNCGTQCEAYVYDDYCSNTSTTITYDDYPWGESYISAMTVGDCVTDIDSGVGSSLRILNLGNSVQHIGSTAFQWNRISNLVIPDSVTSIGNTAFGNSYSLRTIEIGSGITSIGDGAFKKYTGATGVLESVTIKAVTLLLLDIEYLIIKTLILLYMFLVEVLMHIRQQKDGENMQTEWLVYLHVMSQLHQYQQTNLMLLIMMEHRSQYLVMMTLH